MRFKRRHHRLLERLDPTPMTDVIFNLVIFFMIGASFGLPAAIGVKLPSASTAQTQLEKDIVITVNKDSGIFLNNKAVSLDLLDNSLKSKLRYKKDKTVILRADRQVKHGLIVEILDKAKLSGAGKLAIATEIKSVD